MSAGLSEAAGSPSGASPAAFRCGCSLNHGSEIRDALIWQAL